MTSRKVKLYVEIVIVLPIQTWEYPFSVFRKPSEDNKSVPKGKRLRKEETSGFEKDGITSPTKKSDSPANEKDKQAAMAIAFVNLIRGSDKVAKGLHIKLPKKKKKTWQECAECPVHLDNLATPKPRIDTPINKLGWVSPAALKYTPTENVLKLATNFERFKNILPPLQLGIVRRSALLYKVTPRTEILAVPKKRNESEVEDSEWDPWAIPKNALKYKATPRMLELAKPKERE